MINADSVVQYDAITGSKWSGGFGETWLGTLDYWTLRKRSSQLFETNVYARGIIRRMNTRTIGTGLKLDSLPTAAALGASSDEVNTWSRAVEANFEAWAIDPFACDYHNKHTLYQIQAAADLEGFISGDVLVVLHVDKKTGATRVQLIGGNCVSTPMEEVTNLKVDHGVAFNSKGEETAFYISTEKGHKRIEKFSKSGRLQAYLYSPLDRRLGAVRGTPGLSIVLQSIKDLDGYRDSVTRKVLLSSFITFFVEKDKPGPGSKPVGRSSVGSNPAEFDKGQNTQVEHLLPGTVIDEMAEGEKITPFNPTGVESNYPEMEAAILNTVCWAFGWAPEVLKQMFGSNYSASQAAINETNASINVNRNRMGTGFLNPIYHDWLNGEMSFSRIPTPANILTNRRIFISWAANKWRGDFIATTDFLKTVNAYIRMSDKNWISDQQACADLTGQTMESVIRSKLELQDLKKELGYTEEKEAIKGKNNGKA